MRRLFLLFLAGCGGQLVIPLYDEASVLPRYPGLRGHVLQAAEYRPLSIPRNEERWSDEDRMLAIADRLWLRSEGMDRKLVVPPDGKVDFPTAGKIACANRRLGDVRQELERVFRVPFTLSVQVVDPGADVFVVGMTSFEGRLRGSPDSLRQALVMAENPSRRANGTQILVVSGQKAIVCDFYRYLKDQDESQNIRILPGDVVIATELYDPDRIPAAPEWGAVEQYFLGKLDKLGMIRAIHRCNRPAEECRHFH